MLLTFALMGVLLLVSLVTDPPAFLAPAVPLTGCAAGDHGERTRLRAQPGELGTRRAIDTVCLDCGEVLHTT